MCVCVQALVVKAAGEIRLLRPINVTLRRAAVLGWVGDARGVNLLGLLVSGGSSVALVKACKKANTTIGST